MARRRTWTIRLDSPGVETGRAMLKGLGAAAVLIAVCLALASLHAAHAEIRAPIAQPGSAE